MMKHVSSALLSLVMVLTVSVIHPATTVAAERRTQQNPLVKMVVTPRSADQIAAFYEGREFPADMLAETRKACFFTIGIHNRGKDILWLDTARWSLIASTGDTPSRIHRADWKQRWQTMQVPLRFQSTFRWTLLPEQLDFQPGEREGGNITIARQAEPFTLVARFHTGADKRGPEQVLRFDKLRCAGGEKS